ncbi:hypothetical protein [Limosilactobacillus sp.]|uniref:glycosyl-4,4'-diaponeurosporenoate acyltransferase CrtO family protein n=1 Tax=Limosilactobacillus sp. TaxID=2773925 RepID=UPI003EFD6EF0
MQRITWWTGLGGLVIVAGYFIYPQSLLLSLAITLLVIFYQFGMRLVVGNWLEPRLRLNPTAFWFKVGKGENRLYHLLRVKKWKKFLPTYSPAKYDLKKHTLKEVIKTMTAAEVDHELMFLLSYLPVLLIIPLGAPLAFILSSVAASLVEIPFIILQRYNRARLARLLGRRSKRQE